MSQTICLQIIDTYHNIPPKDLIGSPCAKTSCVLVLALVSSNRGLAPLQYFNEPAFYCIRYSKNEKKKGERNKKGTESETKKRMSEASVERAPELERRRGQWADTVNSTFGKYYKLLEQKQVHYLTTIENIAKNKDEQ